MKPNRKPRPPQVTIRTADRIRRLAYEMEALASRLRAAGFDSEGNGINGISSELGDIGRGLADKLGGED